MSTRTAQNQYSDLFTPGSPTVAIGTSKDDYWTLPIMNSGDAMGRHTENWKQWLRHPAYDDWWKEVSIEDKYERIAVPAYLADSWFDLYNQGAPVNFNGIRSKGKTEAARTGTRLLMGPWTHNLGALGTATKVGDLDFGPSSLFPLTETQLRWFDFWLKGIQNGMDREPPLKIYVMGDNVWRDEHEWPLARTQYTKYYLSSGGKANSVTGDGVAQHDGADQSAARHVHLRSALPGTDARRAYLLQRAHRAHSDGASRQPHQRDPRPMCWSTRHPS